jgi:hypothetical protein
MRAEALDDAAEPRSRREAHQRAEPVRHADVTRREHVDAPKATSSTTAALQGPMPGSSARVLSLSFVLMPEIASSVSSPDSIALAR